MGLAIDRARQEGAVPQYVLDVWDQQPGRDTDTLTDAAAVVVEESPGGYVAQWFMAPNGHTDSVVRALVLEPTGPLTPDGGVTANLLRTFSPTAVRAALGRFQAGPTAGPGTARAALDRLIREDTKVTFAKAPNESRKRTGGRPPTPDETLIAVAFAYLQELPAGPGLLARVGDRPEIDRPQATVRDWVSVARKRGFLTPAQKSGSRGAGPGPNFPIELLEAAGLPWPADNREGQL